MRTLYFFTLFWVHQISILPKQFRLKKQILVEGQMADSRREAWSIAHGWGEKLLKWSGARIERRGNDPIEGEAVLVVSNHQGGFDIPLLLGELNRPLGFVAKKELGSIPLVSTWMGLIGCIFLNREDRREQIRQIKETIETIKSGHSMVIFPEGTRSGGPKMGEFAKGSLNIAQKAGAKILPVTISGSYKLMPADKKGIHPADVVVTFHEPIDPASLSKEEQAELHLRVRDVIASGLTE